MSLQSSSRRDKGRERVSSVSSSASHRHRKAAAPPPPLPPPPPAPRPFVSTAERNVVVLSTCLKILLFQAYHSTDFEVHRNWLAITHSLPLSQWYYNTSSEWTLDYPPFFAYFERVLAGFAYLVDPKIVQLSNLNYDAWSVVAFQRSTVVVSELVLVAAAFQWARRSQKPDYPTAFTIAASIILHPGLLIVDHIHFQYNGMLLGILLWSIIAARAHNLLACAALFTVLLNFKHIFIYLAPPYFIFLLRRHCFTSSGSFQLDRVLELALIVISITAVSFGPFVIAGGPSQLLQIGSRLFPFQRGLNHAYWAANVWAVVSAADRLLVKYLIKRGWPIAPAALVSASRGLVGNTTFGVLPTITPALCFSITMGFSLLFLTKLWFDPSYRRFLDAVVLSAMTSFLWGWHVHEKAVLLFLIPLGLTAVEDDTHLRAYLVASAAGIFSLFPLLIKSQESPIKLLFGLLWCAIVFPSLRRVVYRPTPTLVSWLVDRAEWLYLVGFFFLQLYVGIIHEIIFPPLPHWFWSTNWNYTAAATSTVTSAIASASVCAASTMVDSSCAVENIETIVEAAASSAVTGGMEFLPLMLTSLYCAIGIVWAWLRLSWSFMVG